MILPDGARRTIVNITYTLRAERAQNLHFLEEGWSVVRKQGERTDLWQKLSVRPKISFDAEIFSKKDRLTLRLWKKAVSRWVTPRLYKPWVLHMHAM